MPLAWFGYYAKPPSAASPRGFANVTPSDKLKQSECYCKHFASFKYDIPCKCNIYYIRPWSNFKRSLNIDGMAWLWVWGDRSWLWSDPRGFFNLQSVQCTSRAEEETFGLQNHIITLYCNSNLHTLYSGHRPGSDLHLTELFNLTQSTLCS